MSDLTGTVVNGRYRVDQFIGRGGMADVYKVWDTERAAFLAMKILHEGLAEDQIFLRRFRREAQTLAKLKHPHIVRFYELGQDGELVYMLMEYVDGITLSKARNRWGSALTPAQVLGILQPVCSALHYAHQLELIHCDIKPGNIMIDRAGRPLLTDFGIARVSEGATTATMVGAGTPAYMSPEQIAGEDPSPQTDIYSLGVVLYELLTGGERPFTGEHATITGTTGEKIRWEKRNLTPPSPRLYNPSISNELEEIILHCLDKNRDNRFRSVDELLENLTKVIGVPAEPLPTVITARDDKRVQAAIQPNPPLVQPVSAAISKPNLSHRGLWIAGGSFLVLGLGAVILALGVLIFNQSKGATLFGQINPTASEEQPTSEQQPAAVIITQNVPNTQESQPIIEPTSTVVVPPVTVTKEHDSHGSYLVVKGGPENYDIRYGPISDGGFVVADNDKFAAYVDNNGVVYVMNFRSETPRAIKNLGKKDLQALAADDTPNYSLSFQLSDSGIYSLIIEEEDYGDIVKVVIPSIFTE